MPCIGRFVACALALCAISAPAALADPPGIATSVSGTLELTHEDTATGQRPISILSTSDGPQVVHFAPGEPVPPNGAEVRLHGRVNGATIEADSATIIGPTLAVPTGAPADGGAGQTAAAGSQSTPLAAGAARTIAIVVITFAGGTPPAYTDAYLQGVLVSNANSVSNYFVEQSYGQVSFTGINSPNGDVYHASIASNGSGCNTNAGWPTWSSQADAAVGSVAQQLRPRHLRVQLTRHAAGGPAWATCPAARSTSTTRSRCPSSPTSSATTSACTTRRRSAASSPVSRSRTRRTANACSFSEYGDPYDIMGSSATNQQNAFHKLQSGWIGGAGEPGVKTITTSGDYTLAPLEWSSASGTALLLIPNVTGAVVGGSSLGQDFALDLRQTYGSYFDAFARGVGRDRRSADPSRAGAGKRIPDPDPADRHQPADGDVR